MDKKIIGILVVAAVVGGVAGYASSQPSTTTVVEKQVLEGEEKVGAVSGPLSPYDYEGIGGLVTFKRQQTLITATTTVCAIQAPAATSTLRRAAIQINLASSTQDAVLTIAKGAAPTATTTIIGQQFTIRKTQGFAVTASSTDSTTNADVYTFAPNTWLNMSLQGGQGVYSPTGVCQAEWDSFLF